jgi:outer membrane protein assembly factor BamB
LEPPTEAWKWNPQVADGTVLVNTRKAGLAAFDARDGNLLWTCKWARGARTVYDERIFITRFHGEYLIVDLADGKVLLRQRRLNGRRNFTTTPVVSQTHVFVGDTSGTMWALERDTGEVVWKHRPKGMTGYMAAKPAVVGKRIYINSFSMPRDIPSSLYCYEAKA